MKSRFFFTRRFFPLFVTQFLGAFNDNAFKNAFLIWYTFEAVSLSSLDPEIVVTLSAGLFILPFLLFSATAGQLADKFEKSKITQIIKQIEIVLMIGSGLGFYFQSVTTLMIILFFMGMHSTFFGPIKYSLLPEHLKDEELISGNAFIEGGTFLSILIGTIFGGIVIRLGSGLEIYSVAVILFAIVGWWSSRSIPTSPISDPELKVGWNIFKETWKIVGYAREERTVWLSIVGISWFWFVGVTFLTQFPVYTKLVIGGDEQIVTFLLTIFSIGIGIGSVMCNKLLKGQINGRLVPAGAFGITFAIFLFKIESVLYTAKMQSLFPGGFESEISLREFLTSGVHGFGIWFSLLLLAIMSGIYIVPLYAIMQHRSNPKYMSRIIATNNVINALFMVVASIIGVIFYAMGLTVTNILFLVGIMNIPVYFIIRDIVKKRLGQHA